MTFHHEAGLPRATLAVGERVGRSIGQFDADALAVADIDGRAVRIVERQSVEEERSLQLTVHPERTVVRLSAQHVSNLVAGIVGSLYKRHMSAFDRCLHVGSDVTGDDHLGRLAAIGHLHRIVLHLRIIDGDAGDVVQDVCPLANGERHAVGKGHLACLSSRNSVGHAALMDIHCLSLRA